MYNKVIFSSGIGKLTTIDSALSFCDFAEADLHIGLYTSWVPSRLSLRLLSLVGLESYAKRLEIRRSAKGKLASVTGFLVPELLYHAFLKQFFRNDTALFVAFRLYGIFSGVWLLFSCNSKTIVHIRSGAGFFAISIAKAKGATVIVDHSIADPRSFGRLFDAVPKEYLENSVLDSQNGLWKQVLADCYAADSIVVNSEFVKSTFLENEFPRERIFVNYLAVDVPTLERIFEKPRNGKPILVFAGHFDIRKGANIIVDMMYELSSRNIDVELHVYGSISVSGREILKRLGTPKGLIFRGYVIQKIMWEEMLQAKGFVFPTYMEGCARAVMEAMALGIPVITTEESGAPITNGINGILLSGRDAGVWADKVESLLADEEMASNIGSKALEYVTEKQNEAVYVETLNGIYKYVNEK